MPPLQVVSVIGADPGPTTGLSFLDYVDGKLADSMQVQVDGAGAVLVLETVLAAHYPVTASNIIQRFGQVEAFVTGQSAGTKGTAAEVTRQLVFQLLETLQVYGYHTQLRKKADVSSWGSDKRLRTAGILRPPEMRHANDASRHGLYTAVHDAYMGDPLR